MSSNNNIPVVSHPYKTAKDQKRYVRDILLQVRQEETLQKMVDIISKIDYAVIYNLDNDVKLSKISELRDELEKEKDIEKRNKLVADLGAFEPGEDIKYIILIEELLAHADEFNLGIGIEPDSILPYIYSGCYWKSISVSDRSTPSINIQCSFLSLRSKRRLWYIGH